MCFTPSPQHTGGSWGSRHPADGELLSRGGQGRIYGLMAMGMRHLTSVPGPQSPVPSTDVKNRSVLPCSLSLCVMPCPATPMAQNQLFTQPEAACIPGMPITDLEPRSLGLESLLCPLWLCDLGPSLLSLHLSFLINKTQMLDTTPQNRLRIKRDHHCRGPERASGCLESHSKRAEKMLDFLFPSPKLPLAPASPSWVWGPMLGPASCWRSGLCNLAAGLHELRKNRPSGRSGWAQSLLRWPDLASPGGLICPFSPFPPG